MVKSKIINVDGHKCKLTLVKGTIHENDFVVSKHRFERMDENGMYNCTLNYKPIEVEIEKVILINIGTTNNHEIVLGFPNGGICHNALQQMYSIVNVELIN